MAIVQVSRITNRKGLAENLPQLAGAELGWAIDERRLFIGNGTLDEGAPTIGNTEILTQFSDILAEQSNYTYKGLAAGYQATTGPDNTDIVQTLQNWLDQFASVRDFGAVGDGVTDDTEAINRALFQLYCREINPEIRRSLFFPAGTYRITEPISIPSYAKIVGEGANSSVITLDTTSDNSTAYPYVAQFADSLQQTGVNIGNNGAIAPTNIEISNIGFHSEMTTADIFLVESASFCSFTDVSFRGPFVRANLFPDPSAVITSDISAVKWNSATGLTCTDITFRRCEFQGLTNAVYSNTTTKGCMITESKFNLLYQGIVFSDPGASNAGSAGFRILGNSFDNIHQEALTVATNQELIISSSNIFYDVANGLSSPRVPSTYVIDFLSDNNVSIGDMFERTDLESDTRVRVRIGTTACITFTNGKQIQMGSFTRQSGLTATLNTSASATALFTVDGDEYPAFRLDYTITRATGDSTERYCRSGTFQVVGSSDGTGTDLSIQDIGVENTAPGFTLTAAETDGVITVQYNDSLGDPSALPGIIKYSMTYLA